MTLCSRLSTWWVTRHSRRITRDARLVVNILRCVPDMRRPELQRRTGLPAARLYLALEHLERDGQVRRTWRGEAWSFHLVQVTS